MSILKVCRLGHPVLRLESKRVEKDVLSTPAIQTLIDNMMETMVEYSGVGLAAPQVHESLAIAVIESRGARGDIPMTVLVNPDITVLDEEFIEDWEGCLSIPDIRGRVPRPREIRLRGYTRDGARLDRTLRDFPARVAQHEADHLDGILFFDRMKSFESLTFLEEYSRYHTKD